MMNKTLLIYDIVMGIIVLFLFICTIYDPIFPIFAIGFAYAAFTYGRDALKDELKEEENKTKL
jgi:hypothetical protein